MFGMRNLFDGKDRERRQAEKKVEQMKREWRAQVDERLMRAECRADLLACRKKFEAAIFRERQNIRDRQQRGTYSQRQIDRCKTRIRNAATGIMIVEDALDELEHAGADFDISATMNSLNLALGRLGHISDSTPDLGGFFFQRRLKRLYTSDDEITDALSQIPLPDDVKIEDSFLEMLMRSNGSFEDCLRQSVQGHMPGMNAETSASRQMLDNLPDVPLGTDIPQASAGGLTDADIRAFNAIPDDKPSF